MVESVVNEIVQGIANKIALLYKDKGKYPIYTDRKKQNLERPCFFIKVLNGEEKKEIGLKDRFYKDLLSIVIIGHAIDEDTEVLNDMIDTLYELHFFIDYSLFIKKDNNETTKMDDYNLNGEVKENEGN